MIKPVELPGIRNITVSGRIATGATTLAHHISVRLGWRFLDGGKLFRQFAKEQGVDIVNAQDITTDFDLKYEENTKRMLREESQYVIQSHLAGFDAQGIPGVFKILVLCEDEDGNDKADIRIDRLMNRDNISIDEAKHEVLERERQNLAKWRKLYVNDDQTWVNWDKKYYDLIVNSFSHNQEESLELVLNALKVK